MMTRQDAVTFWDWLETAVYHRGNGDLEVGIKYMQDNHPPFPDVYVDGLRWRARKRLAEGGELFLPSAD